MNRPAFMPPSAIGSQAGTLVPVPQSLEEDGVPHRSHRSQNEARTSPPWLKIVRVDDEDEILALWGAALKAQRSEMASTGARASGRSSSGGRARSRSSWFAQ